MVVVWRDAVVVDGCGGLVVTIGMDGMSGIVTPATGGGLGFGLLIGVD